jgi:hypothetical protein
LLGILSAYVIVVVVVVVVDVVYAIRVYGPFFLSRLSYRLADITDVFLRTIVTDRQQKKGKEREREKERKQFWFAVLISYTENISTQ